MDMGMVRRLGALSAVLLVSSACATAGVDEPVVGYAPVNGGTIEYVVSGPADGEPVLLIQGVGVADVFAPIAAEPALADYRLIRIHRRGYAGSSEIEGDAFSMADQAADAAGLLDALGIERAHVVGHSYGGAVGMEMTAVAPEKVQSLTLIDPANPPGVPSPPGLDAAAGEAAGLLAAGPLCWATTGAPSSTPCPAAMSRPWAIST
jgi:pimeloyl-ACP methyl ester carboxylesterase